MALSFGDVVSFLPKLMELGGSFAAPSREGPDLGFLRDAIAKREGYVDKMIAPPPELVAAEEAEMRRAQIQRMNQLLAGLRRGVRRGGPNLVDRERMDDLGRFIGTPGPGGRNAVREMFRQAAQVPTSPLAAQLGQTAQTGRRSDFLNRLGFGAGLLGDVLRQGQQSSFNPPSSPFSSMAGSLRGSEFDPFGGGVGQKSVRY